MASLLILAKYGTPSNIVSVTLPESVTSMGDYSFSGCYNIKVMKIASSVTSIGDGAFYNCSSLTSITIPDSVTSIGEYAFMYCSSLTRINYTGTIDEWNLITKCSNWNDDTCNYTVYCTDGEIAKS